jgi:hypothetical protein
VSSIHPVLPVLSLIWIHQTGCGSCSIWPMIGPDIHLASNFSLHDVSEALQVIGERTSGIETASISLPFSQTFQNPSPRYVSR